MFLEMDGKVDRLAVLDHGYVRMEQSMGNDLTTVNAAKVSFDKRSDTFKDRDQKLVNFLGENQHTSPFRHSVMTFEAYAPMFVKNQWWKYVVGHMHDPMQAWNESSRRYVTEEPLFYVPQWRSAPEDKKQGSGDFIEHERAIVWDNWFRGIARQGEQYYNMALEQGIAPEQARVFLPAYAMYVRWWWTCSLQGALHLIEQRTAPDAQWEFQEYAKAIESLVREKFPVATQALLGR
jgi:thymidylate synthase (FAD)